MGQGIIRAAFAALAGMASTAGAVEIPVASDGEGLQVIAERTGDRIVFRSISPATVHVGYDIDADGNGRIDPAVDRAYSMQRDGTLCAASWVNERETSFCGKTKSAATASRELIGTQVLRRLELPLSEVSRDGRNVRLRLSTFYENRGWTYAWIRIDLAAGVATALAAPAAATVATAAKPATATTPGKPATPARPAGGLSDQALSDRFDAGEVYMGRECKYRQLPDIRLHGHRYDGPIGIFEVRPRESDSVYNNELRFNVYPDGREKFRLVVSNDVHRPAKVTSATLVIGNASFPLRAIHPIDKTSPTVTFKPYVSFEELPSGARDALMQASGARLVLATRQGQVSQWTYPVGNLRYLPRAMSLSQWTCPGW